MKHTRFLSLLLVVVMLLCALASCGGGDQTTTTTQATTTTTTTTGGGNPPLPPPPQDVPAIGEIVKVSTADSLAKKLLDEGFIIVGAERASNAVNTASATVINILKGIDKWGTVVDDDFEAREDGAKEIQIGTIRREGTQTAATALAANRQNSSHDWKIVVSTDTISIIGATDDGLCLALAYFAKMLEGDADLFYPAFDTGVQRYPWSLTQLGGAPIGDFRIVLAKGANLAYQNLATKIQTQIKTLSGYTLPIVDDSSAVTDKELILGKTARPVSASALSTLRDERTVYTYDGFLFANGTQIALFGDEADSTAYAVENFMASYLTESTQGALANIKKLYPVDGITELTFTAIADFHYKEGMYMSMISDIDAIMKRAQEAGSDFVMHAGDHCNDYNGSPELDKAWQGNSYGLEVYGVYGNHELEGSNSMETTTPRLTNRAERVVWGTADGKIGDGSIGYYYFDKGAFRIIALDTNYSWDPEAKTWVHVKPWGWGPPTGTERGNSCGPTQLAWLEEVLDDAVTKRLSCIVVSHAGIGGAKGEGDAPAIKQMFRAANNKRAGTVIMGINGHYHTNHIEYEDDVLYLDLNTVRNGDWQPTQEPHYTDEHTFEYTKYDNEGNPISTEQGKLNELAMATQTWFFKDPTSAVITVSTSGRIIIDGCETEWIYGVKSSNEGVISGCEPKISSGIFNVPVAK